MFSDHWAPFEADATSPWTLRRVVHLHRRAAFAATWEELQRDLRDGPIASVGRLMAGTACTTPADFASTAQLLADAAVAEQEINRLKAWWFYRMLFGADPLTERLTLFWHNHFATANSKVEDARKVSQQLAHVAGRDDLAKYPSTGLAERLKLAARLLKSDLGARVFYTTQTGFDTHVAQKDMHSGLLSEFAGAVAAFFEDLQAAKLSERVALLVFSEFGRTIRENGSGGTDHGTAGVVLLAGNMPSLTDLGDGEPKMTTDFRRINTSVLESWLGISSRDAVGGSFEPAALFRN